MSDELTLVVLLYLHPGKRPDFEEFEAAASRIMGRYGGSITERILPSSILGDDPPDEIHLVRFPDEDSFSAYRADTDLGSLAQLRQSAIRATVIWRGEHRAPWVDPSF